MSATLPAKGSGSGRGSGGGRANEKKMILTVVEWFGEQAGSSVCVPSLELNIVVD
jgi:hypothetical protein